MAAKHSFFKLKVALSMCIVRVLNKDISSLDGLKTINMICLARYDNDWQLIDALNYNLWTRYSNVDASTIEEADHWFADERVVGGSETSSKPRDELKKQIDDYEDTATIRSDLDSVEEERDDAKSDVVRLDETRKSRDNLEKELWEMIHALKEGTLKVEDLVEPSLEDDEGNAAGEDGDA